MCCKQRTEMTILSKKQDSPPAWTQEAYRPPLIKYSVCCPVPGAGVPPNSPILTWLGGTPGGRPLLAGVPPGGVDWQTKWNHYLPSRTTYGVGNNSFSNSVVHDPLFDHTEYRDRLTALRFIERKLTELKIIDSSWHCYYPNYPPPPIHFITNSAY